MVWGSLTEGPDSLCNDLGCGLRKGPPNASPKSNGIKHFHRIPIGVGGPVQFNGNLCCVLRPAALAGWTTSVTAEHAA